MAKSEHILLESEERAIPDRHTAQKIHASVSLRSRLRRRALTLEVIDYYFLSVRVCRARSLVREYVLDLRFIDPQLISSRHVAWRWIAATLALGALFSAAVWWVASSSAPFWKQDRLLAFAAILSLTVCAGFVAAYRTTETWTMNSVYGKARMLQCTGGLGTLRTLRPFAKKLAAHIQLAVAARRPSKSEHLRDEMREHFRLKAARVLTEQEYETSKMRILRTHSPTSAGARSAQV